MARKKTPSYCREWMFGADARINLDETKVLVSALVPFGKDITEGAKRISSPSPFYFLSPLCITLEMMKICWRARHSFRSPAGMNSWQFVDRRLPAYCATSRRRYQLTVSSSTSQLARLFRGLSKIAVCLEETISPSYTIDMDKCQV